MWGRSHLWFYHFSFFPELAGSQIFGTGRSDAAALGMQPRGVAAVRHSVHQIQVTALQSKHC